MGGAIGVTSSVGVGSVFWVEFHSASAPLSPHGAAPALAPSPPHVERGGPMHTLLYVEDNPANLKLVEHLVARRPDMQLLSAVTGTRGVELARAARPDVILMDINLPGMSGTEAMRMLRNDPATAHIPVIALSANAIPHDIERGLEAGFFLYLTKPVKVNDFMQALDRALAFAATGSAKLEEET